MIILDRSMIFQRNYFLNTTSEIDVLAVTHDVLRLVRESQIRDGIVVVLCPQSGAGVTIIETLPDVVKALKGAVALFPGQNEGTKNLKKEDVPIGPRVSAAMLGKSVSIPLKNGALTLAPREDVVIVDMERGARRREFVVHIMGEAAQQQGQGPQQVRR